MKTTNMYMLTLSTVFCASMAACVGASPDAGEPEEGSQESVQTDQAADLGPCQDKGVYTQKASLQITDEGTGAYRATIILWQGTHCQDAHAQVEGYESSLRVMARVDNNQGSSDTSDPENGMANSSSVTNDGKNVSARACGQYLKSDGAWSGWNCTPYK